MEQGKTHTSKQNPERWVLALTRAVTLNLFLNLVQAQMPYLAGGGAHQEMRLRVPMLTWRVACSLSCQLASIIYSPQRVKLHA